MKFNRIIAAIDIRDDLAEGVVSAAVGLAQKDGAGLEVVTVWPPLGMSASGLSGDVAASAAALTQAAVEQHKEGRKDLEDKLGQLVSRRAPSAKAVVLDGEAADEIAKYAKDEGADLIVTGSHQRSFWGALFSGSASRELIHEAPCAVFLVTKALADTLA